MKRLMILMLAILFAGAGFAQTADTNVQQPAPAPEVKQEVKEEKKEKKEDKKDDKPEIKQGFTIFAGYLWNPSTIQGNATNFNSFTLSRAFIDFNVDFKNGMTLRVTPDINLTTSGWILRLRNAALNWKLLDELTLSFGLIPTEWIPFADDIAGIRYITPSAPDRLGLRSSVDIGLSLTVRPIKGIEGFVGVFDGNGFGRGSDSIQTNLGFINVTKEVGGRLLVAPLFLLTGDTNYQNIYIGLHTYNTIIPTPDMTNASGTEIYGVGLGVNFSPIRLFVNYSLVNFVRAYVSTINANYFTVAGKINFGFVGLKELSIVGGFYTYDPNINVSDNEQNFYLGGLEFVFNKYLTVSGNVKIDQRKDGYKAFNNSTSDYQTILGIDTLIRL
ncbi:MAG: hypothetical protein N3D81_02005 [Spirochaetes bacterium]|nr:hypothetical protein [Spirochaetota bacterium]